MRVLRSRLFQEFDSSSADGYGVVGLSGDGLGCGQYGEPSEDGSGLGCGNGFGYGWQLYERRRDGGGYGYGEYGLVVSSLTGEGCGDGAESVELAYPSRSTRLWYDRVAVLITTMLGPYRRRGVFFAYIDPRDAAKETIYAEQIRIAAEWSAECRGVLGLASLGPTGNCRVSPSVPAGYIRGVTLVVEVTPEAEAAWTSTETDRSWYGTTMPVSHGCPTGT
jgi:hypothetical protein